MKRQHVVDGDEPLFFDHMIVAAPATATTVSRAAPFFDGDEGRFERQAGVRKDSREVDQFVEQVDRRALFRTGSTLHHATAGPVQLDQLLADDDRLDDANSMLAQQASHFVADGGQAAVLDLHQFVAHDDVDAEAVERHFLASAVGGVEQFELAVERGFHRRP